MLLTRETPLEFPAALHLAESDDGGHVVFASILEQRVASGGCLCRRLATSVKFVFRKFYRIVNTQPVIRASWVHLGRRGLSKR